MAEKKVFYRVVPPGGISYLTDSLKEVLDEVKLCRVGGEIVIKKEVLDTDDADRDPTFVRGTRANN